MKKFHILANPHNTILKKNRKKKKECFEIRSDIKNGLRDTPKGSIEISVLGRNAGSQSFVTTLDIEDNSGGDYLRPRDIIGEATEDSKDFKKPSSSSTASSGSEWSAWKPHAVTLDFTPTEEDEELTEKCSFFLNHFLSNKNIQRLIMLPQKEDVTKGTKMSPEEIEKEREGERFKQERETLTAVTQVACIDSGLVGLAAPHLAECHNFDTDYELKSKKVDIMNLCKDMEEFDLKNPKYEMMFL